MTSLAAAYRTTRTRLTEAGIDSAALDARLIMDAFAGAKPEDIVCKPLTEIGPDAATAIEAAVARRLAGEPVHRILGWREFYGLRLMLSPETLEPRADTETLVDAVLPFVRERAADTGSCRILDLGTGTGAIPLALLSQEPKAAALATDISADALATARKNAESLGLSARFETLQSSWFDAVSGRFDLIVSNPPYIRSDVIPALEVSVRDYDPMAALDGGADGLDAYRAIASTAADHLAEGGLMAVEIGFDQAESAGSVFALRNFAVISLDRDLAGKDRVLLLKMRQ